MNVFFLSADRPIVKSYCLNTQGELSKKSYPFVYEVTSHEEKPANLQDLSVLIQKYAKSGSCMLKGTLQRPLVSESRKGSTNPDEKTDWICLDLDGVDNYANINAFLDEIGCGNTDHIVQWSSSMKIENTLGLRCHVFMRLAKPMTPALIKFWLMDINLSIPNLCSQLQLTKTGNSLRYPLDITTCQNDKLIYIAPPHLGAGIKNPFPGNKRISFEKRAHRALTLPTNIPTKDALRQAIDKRVAEA